MATKKPRVKIVREVGDSISTVLYRSTGDEVGVIGKVKKVRTSYGHKTYTITKGVITKDFDTRIIKK